MFFDKQGDANAQAVFIYLFFDVESQVLLSKKSSAPSSMSQSSKLRCEKQDPIEKVRQVHQFKNKGSGGGGRQNPLTVE